MQNVTLFAILASWFSCLVVGQIEVAPTIIYEKQFDEAGTLKVIRRELSDAEIHRRWPNGPRKDLPWPRAVFEHSFELHPSGDGPPRRLYTSTIILYPNGPDGGAQKLAVLDARVESGICIIVYARDELVCGVVVTDRVVIPSKARRTADVLTTGGPANGYISDARISGSVRDGPLVVDVYRRGKPDHPDRFALESKDGEYRWAKLGRRTIQGK